MNKPKDIWIKCWTKTFFQTSRDQHVTQVFCRNRKSTFQTQFIGTPDPELAIHWAKQLFETELLNTLDGSDETSLRLFYSKKDGTQHFRKEVRKKDKLE